MRLLILDEVTLMISKTEKTFKRGRILRFTPEKAREHHDKYPGKTRLYPDDKWKPSVKSAIKKEMAKPYSSYSGPENVLDGEE